MSGVSWFSNDFYKEVLNDLDDEQENENDDRNDLDTESLPEAVEGNYVETNNAETDKSTKGKHTKKTKHIMSSNTKQKYKSMESLEVRKGGVSCKGTKSSSKKSSQRKKVVQVMKGSRKIIFILDTEDNLKVVKKIRAGFPQQK